MGKYFDGNTFNYIKTGKRTPSNFCVSKYILEIRRRDRCPNFTPISLEFLRFRKIAKLFDIVKICQRLVNGVVRQSILNFIAIKNRVSQLLKSLKNVWKKRKV